MTEPQESAQQSPHKRLTVLHPTDLTADGEVAFAHALRIAIEGDSSIRLLHVSPADEAAPWEKFPTAGRLLNRWGWLDGEPTDEDLAELGVDVASLEVESYNTVRSLLNYLDKHPVDMIVFATHGRSGLEAWWHGSTAEPVARLSRTMCLFVPHGVRGFVSLETGDIKLETVLVPVCKSPDPEPSFLAARSLMESLRIDAYRLVACCVSGEPPELDDGVELVTPQGDVVEQIVATAKVERADLIVMTTEGRHGFLDALLGSTTERVLREASCPVLAVPSGVPLSWTESRRGERG